MAQITSSVGLISGIDTGNIINQLIAIDSEPVTILQTQISSTQNQEQTYSQLESSLTDMQSIGNKLALPQTFQAADANSSDPSVLSATAAVGAAVGSYQFQVSRLVTTQQSISQGFTNATSSLVGSGTITLEQGGGEASSQTNLSSLNGGAGISRGQFRITDRQGNSSVINISNAVTLDDVVQDINSATGINVTASVTDQGLVLNNTGGGTGTFTVQDVAGGSAAASLGIATTSNTNAINGTNLNFITAATPLSQLNDGNGITTATAAQNDFTITARDGTAINVQLNGSETVGDVITAINTAGGTKLNAAISASGTGITLTDTSGGAGALTIAADNGSNAAAQLGLTTPAVGSTITGRPLIAALDSVLTSSLNGGNGIALGTISVADRAGHVASINLSNATSVSDILAEINNNGTANVTASLNDAGTGIQLIDHSGGTGNLVIGDVSSTTAAQLGIAGTFAPSIGTVNGANLQHQFVSANTQLSTYNGGAGVNLGQFRINNSLGGSATVDLTTGTFNTIGDVMNAINSKNIGVKATIDSTGNGILLSDTNGGPQTLTVTDLGGTAAANLNIAGAATGTTIDGAQQKSITVTNTDTLTTLQNKINAAGFGVTANIISDGSAAAPNRLALTAVNSGRAGRVVIDSGTTNLQLSNLVDAQDAAVFFGGSGDEQPLLLTSSKNQLSNVIRGVSINLNGASTDPVTLNITPDSSSVAQQLGNFVNDFNTIVGQISTDTAFNTTSNTGGILLGDATTQEIQSKLYELIGAALPSASFTSLSQLGISINANASLTGATLSFDTNTFEAAYAANPSAVSNVFAQGTNGYGSIIAKAMTSIVDPVNGVLTLENQTLQTKVLDFQNQITNLNTILSEKREQLQNSFDNMEITLAQLQSQQSVLNSFNGVKATTSTPAASSSTSSSSSGSSSTG